MEHRGVPEERVCAGALPRLLRDFPDLPKNQKEKQLQNPDQKDPTGNPLHPARNRDHHLLLCCLHNLHQPSARPEQGPQLLLWSTQPRSVDHLLEGSHRSDQRSGHLHLRGDLRVALQEGHLPGKPQVQDNGDSVLCYPQFYLLVLHQLYQPILLRFLCLRVLIAGY